MLTLKFLLFTALLVTVLGQRCNTKCNCPSKYNPYCGTDGVTYRNICELRCATRCNRELYKKFEGVCAEKYVPDNGKRYGRSFHSKEDDFADYDK